MSPEIEAPIYTTRNSHLREVSQNPLESVVGFIDEHASWITPNRLTVAGTIGVVATDYLIARYPKHAAQLSVAHVVFSIADALDGPLARRRAQANGCQTTTGGALLDALSDKAQEFAVSDALSSKASQQGDHLGAVIHMAAGVTSNWPALFRARAESRGHIVAEGGLGTRPLRVTTGVANLLLSDKKHASRLIGLASLSQNVLTSMKRKQAIDAESSYCIGFIEDPELIAASQQRYAMLKAASATTAILGGVLLFRQNREQAESTLQNIAKYTGGSITLSNIIDATAFAAAFKYAPRLNTTEGVVGITASYSSDLVDGPIARATGTTSRIGEVADAAGDKIKTAYTAFYVAKYGLAPRPLLAAVASQNIANAAATVYDRIHNGKRTLQVSQLGKFGAFGNNLGIGLHTIGADLERTGHEVAAKRTKRAGTTIAAASLLACGIPATIQYWKKARGTA